MEKKLYKSRNKKMVSGVCGGLEDYLGIDVTIIRLVWIVLSLLVSGAGIGGLVVYIIASIVIPEEPVGLWEDKKENDNWQRPNSNWQNNTNSWDYKDDTKSENNPSGNSQSGSNQSGSNQSGNSSDGYEDNNK